MLHLITRHINSNHKFVSNIAQSAYVTTSDSTEVPRPTLWSNADEADLHVWLHCMHSQGYRSSFVPQIQTYTTLD